MEIILNKKDVIELIDTGVLADRLAEKIFNDRSADGGYGEAFNREWEKAIKETVKELVGIYMDGYNGDYNVKNEVREYIRRMSKAEILEILTK